MSIKYKLSDVCGAIRIMHRLNCAKCAFSKARCRLDKFADDIEDSSLNEHSMDSTIKRFKINSLYSICTHPQQAINMVVEWYNDNERK